MLVSIDYKLDEELIKLFRLRRDWPIKSITKLSKVNVISFRRWYDEQDEQYQGLILTYLWKGHIFKSEKIIFDEKLNCYVFNDEKQKYIFKVLKTLKKDLMENIMRHGFDYKKEDLID